MKRRLLFIAVLISGSFFSQAQRVGSSPEYIKTLTADWKGERLPDGEFEKYTVKDGIVVIKKGMVLEDGYVI